MPVIEIASWPASDAYLADPNVLTPALQFLKAVDGCLSIYTGVAEEDNKTLFALLVWETVEHHQALMNHPEYPGIIGLGPALGGALTFQHVEFVKDFVPAFSAPTTEILAITLKEGKTKEDLQKVLDSISPKIDAGNPKHAPATWGQTLEDPQKFWVTIGWDSAEAHKEIMGPSFLPDLTDLRNTVDPKMVHASLKKLT